MLSSEIFVVHPIPITSPTPPFPDGSAGLRAAPRAPNGLLVTLGLTVRPSTTFLGADRRFHAERRNEGANDDISRFRTQMYLA